MAVTIVALMAPGLDRVYSWSPRTTVSGRRAGKATSEHSWPVRPPRRMPWKPSASEISTSPLIATPTPSWQRPAKRPSPVAAPWCRARSKNTSPRSSRNSFAQFNPREARFIGTPIDYVVFNGLDEGECEIVLIEVKTGRSQLSPRERRVRQAVEASRVRWVEMRLPKGIIDTSVGGIETATPAVSLGPPPTTCGRPTVDVPTDLVSGLGPLSGAVQSRGRFFKRSMRACALSVGFPAHCCRNHYRRQVHPLMVYGDANYVVSSWLSVSLSVVPTVFEETEEWLRPW